MKILPSDTDFKTVYNHIHQSLPFNKLQRLVKEEILDYNIKNKGQKYFDLERQLLLYLKDKDKMGKSWIVNAIKIGFILLDRESELVISTLSGSVANSVGKSTIDIAICVSSQTQKNYWTKVNI